ncbi:response regulator [Thiosocius teredinicola]|uniref:response regulator n=1 Tax=Thiosocius teredinicola TaxID=1973002 RepID=UPI000990BE8F
MAVLLVDDDVALVAILQEYLEAEGFDVKSVHDGETAVAEALTGQYAIVVLDVMMPRMTGIEVLKQIRAHSRLPVLMLTAKGDETDRIVGLELGADDYVPKPCSARELVARIRAILRRAQGGEDDDDADASIGNGVLRLWPAQRKAEVAGEPLDLTSTEFNLLEVLARNAGRVVSKAELSTHGLGRPLARHDRSIDVHLANIRRKLDGHGAARDCIKTVFRRGYQLISD